MITRTQFLKVAFLLLQSLVVINNQALADNDFSVTPLFNYEQHGSDSYTGVGVNLWLSAGNERSLAAVSLMLNAAEIDDTTGNKQSYTPVEASFKFGYFNDFYVYGEVGFDLGEALLDSLLNRNSNSSNSDYFRQQEEKDKIDYFLGVGSGVKLDKVRLEAIIRYRDVTGPSWQADAEVFTGIQVSIGF